MDVRVKMYRILLGCINSPDLTMHFRRTLERFRTALVLMKSQSQFDSVECFGLS